MSKLFFRNICGLLTAVLIFTSFTPAYGAFEPVSAGSDLSIEYHSSNSLNEHIVPGKVLVKYKDGVSATEAQSTASSYSAKTVKQYNGLGIHTLNIPSSKEVFQFIKEIEKDPNVEYAEPVYKYTASNIGIEKLAPPSVTEDTYFDDARYSEQWSIAHTELESIWMQTDPTKLDDIVIAILDTGVDLDHEDLAGSILNTGFDFIDNDLIPDDEDPDSHGTHVAGIAAGIFNNGTGIAGVAGGAKIMPVRVLDQNGASSVDGSSILQGIIHAVDYGADIINLSLGRPSIWYDEETESFIDTFSMAEYDAIQYAIDHGVVVVAASGNSSSHIDGVGFPVDYPAAAHRAVIVVGASHEDGNGEPILADFSNVGPELDVVAPGVEILSTVKDNGYAYMSGTSMATPFVSGLAALILAGDSNMTPLYEDSGRWDFRGDERIQQIERVLKSTAIDAGVIGRDNLFGDGVVNGQNIISKSRLTIEWPLDITNESELNITLKLIDFKGLAVTDAVYGQGTVDLRLLLLNDMYEFEEVDLNVVDVVYGEASATLTANESGIYLLEAVEQGSRWVNSEIVAAKLLDMPTSNVSSGSYENSISVTLSSEDGAVIYYTLDGSEPNGDSTQYTTPISISQTKTLKAFAVKNYVASSTATYTYTIASNGGGGFVFFAGATTDDSGITEETNADGKTTVTAKPSKTKLLEAINSDDVKEIVVNAKSEKNADKLIVELTQDIIVKAKEKNKPFKLESNQADFLIQPDFVAEEGDILFTVKDVSTDAASTDHKAKEATTASQVFEFHLQVGNKTVKQFEKSIKVTMKLNSAVKDKNKVGVYYFNETSNEWEYIGGKLGANNTITFETDHFSKYAAMEYNKTFEDVKGHWAKADIELMASKHIAKGTSEDNFSPNANITRAEFAALLVRATGVSKTSDKTFADVSKSAWYADAVNKAYAAGIIAGLDDAHFAPNETVTREQMALMVMKAYEHQTGNPLSNINITQEVKFSDEGSVSAWARTFVRLADAKGLMSGRTNGAFDPSQNATRAEAISVIKRLLESE
jgi:subtilisin family serine protease